PQPEVKAVSELVEDVEPRRCVLDLDRVEVELGRQPADAVNLAARARLPLRPPEGMGRHGQPALVVNRVHGRGRRTAGADATLEVQGEDVSVAAGDLLADYHLDLPAPLGAFRGAQRALDGVVVRDGYH